MAGITSCPFKPIHPTSPANSYSRTTTFPYPSTATQLLLFPVSDSKLLGLRFLLRHPASARIVARYGGSASYGDSAWGGESAVDEALNVGRLRSATVRLIDENQNMVGVVSKDEAIRMAADVELDLVILSPDADPPVVRMMDYNKYKYEQQKKKKGQQKKSAASRMDIKELKMGYNIDEHDYAVRLKAARKFLKDGDKVKVIVNLKGRENEFRNIAIELIRRFQDDIGELASEESKNFRDRNIFMTLVPNKAIAQKAREQQPKKKDNAIENEVSANV